VVLDLLLRGQRVSETNSCNVRSEVGHVPYCTHSAAIVMAVTAECVYVCVCVLPFTESKFLCVVDAIKPYIIQKCCID
jgi:hypothetical protein